MDYREAGVDVSAADAAKTRIKALAKGTFNPAVLSEIGSFGGMFRPDFARYEEPVLVASTDGVGTKIQVAILAGIHDTVGYDLVAHCVNDILVQGATPLFFLDYIALGKMDVERVEAIVARLRARLRRVRLPAHRRRDRRDAGDLRGRRLRPRGLHRRRRREAPRPHRRPGARGRRPPGPALGRSPHERLHPRAQGPARALGHRVDTHLPELGTTVGEALLAPHRGYLAALEPLLERDKIRALAHITGGGFQGNLPRVLPEGLGARVRAAPGRCPPSSG